MFGFHNSNEFCVKLYRKVVMRHKFLVSISVQNDNFFSNFIQSPSKLNEIKKELRVTNYC